MACPSGTRKKAGVPRGVYVSTRDLMCGKYGEDSLICKHTKYGMYAIPYILLNADELCASTPPPMPDLSFIDLLSLGNFQNILTDVSKIAVWSQYCECKPTPTPPPFSGGQCVCVAYRAIYRFNRTYQGEFYSSRSGVSVWGPVGGIRYQTSGNIIRHQVFCRGYVSEPCLSSQTWINAYESTFLEGQVFTTINIEEARREDGLADNCGDPEGDGTPNPPPPEPPPPNFDPDIPPPPNFQTEGSPGPKGDKGDTGDTGATGATGAKGDKGDKGDTGSKGDPGNDGAKGEPGDVGAVGAPGIAGDKGEKGDKGDAGIPGTNGRDGLPGSDGAMGRDGLPGIQGERGIPGLSIKGDKGDKGDIGLPGRDAEVEFEPVTVTYSDCNAAGELVERSVSFQVIKGAEGSTKQLYTSLFSAMGSLEASVCKVTKSVDNLDLNVGIPLAAWERSTAVNTVLYFNDSRSTARGIGRYICIPEPNNQKILEWAATDPEWLTGNWHYYTQYLTSKGAKISSFSVSFEKSVDQQTILKSFTNYQPTSIYFDSTPRMLHNKRELQLRLKRVTYFPGTIGQEGQQEGNIIFTNPLMR